MGVERKIRLSVMAVFLFIKYIYMCYLVVEEPSGCYINLYSVYLIDNAG